ncbi:Hint domain-containing protein [Jiella sp. MQZ13P-4]|uniref:Hint domain-containing protein n=1 Tax=Jiella sonneratiae TaxID=2816856 RepID=A0ABS3J915_9HYPH|nr:Hint domain-containing protein [Jiella sonneratiae]
MWLSAAHAVRVSVVDDLLVPVGALVNGSTIRQVQLDRIAYYHIELDGHDVLLANGLPAESYLDCGNRRFFLGADIVPEDGRVDAHDLPFCLPFTTDPEILGAVRARLMAQARRLGWTEEPAGPEIRVEIEADAAGEAGMLALPLAADEALRLTLPADAGDAWLLSSCWVPAHHGGTADKSTLGVVFRGLTLTDETGATQRIAADDSRLTLGFHPLEGDWRWTTGRALLPAALWEGLSGEVTLTLDLLPGQTRRWVAPAAVAEEPVRPVRERALASA